MALPPLRNPADPARAWQKGSVGSARVWASGERAPAAPPRGVEAEGGPRSPLEALVTRAVARSVERNMPLAMPQERASLEREISGRILALLTSPAEPPARERTAGLPGADAPPEEPEPSSTAAAPKAAAPLSDRLRGLELRHPSLARRLRAILPAAELGGAPPEGLLERILGWVDEEASRLSVTGKAQAALSISAEDALTLDVLERRLRKLRTSVRNARELRRRLAGMKDFDPGVASIYRQVQGLAELDALAEVKREMLKEIFQANLDFQKRSA